ncbi:hypothetical protein [Amycolatopsis sp. CA-230715]|uniref:hypothetical protein n=1 Tax=Amycolatopsis sp. CA-230715 TaxID=2745196 RepID=UPI001C037EBF|nr:hypothetical protein [Amycolatopsis sp. CA-230715]
MLAVLVGVVRPDGNAFAHFGSLRGFNDHLSVVKRLGLVRDADASVDDGAPEFVPTDPGREFVDQFRLTELPDGRANYWNLNHNWLVEPAATELARRWDALQAASPSAQDGVS